MKILKILILFIFIQFILTEITEEEKKAEEEKCFNTENPSEDTCKEVNISKINKNCCFFSYVARAKRVNMCFAIEKDEYIIQRFLNSLESNKVTTDSITADDAIMDCLSNINKYKYKIFFILLFML